MSIVKSIALIAVALVSLGCTKTSTDVFGNYKIFNAPTRLSTLELYKTSVYKFCYQQRCYTNTFQVARDPQIGDVRVILKGSEIEAYVQQLYFDSYGEKEARRYLSSGETVELEFSSDIFGAQLLVDAGSDIAFIRQ